jgi:hypothetical protein
VPGPDSCSAASSIFIRALRPPGRAESAGYESSLMSCGRSRASSIAKMPVVGHSGGSAASAAPAREGPSPVISRTPTSKVKYDQTHPRMTEN